MQQRLSKLAFLWENILESQMPFTGTFTTNCLSEPVPNVLLSLLQVLLYGSSMITADDQQTSYSRNRFSCRLSNLVISNPLKHFPRSQTNVVQQSRDRETAFPLYTDIKLHGLGRMKIIIKHFHKLGVLVCFVWNHNSDVYILQARPESNINDFFRYENAKEPSFLAFNEKRRSGTKSQIIQCLPGWPCNRSNTITILATVVIFICLSRTGHTCNKSK